MGSMFMSTKHTTAKNAEYIQSHERFRIASACLDQPRCEFPLAEARGSGTGAAPGPHLTPQGSVPGDPVRIDCNITES
ncbi:hypothetical protein E2I00_011223 [Balaenoptera physalus]|uniref:Uncharacterized protein n=1 Tax=Balaenoptera physalus TaxID=9770 RepID=A0A6A1Q0W5_BALPH|nr:hypothetical protein E2I00_011223 [Balaenoptera physalus]